MLYNYSTEKLLGLQGVIVKKVINNNKTTEIDVEMERKEHTCPFCSASTNTIHDYRKQQIKDVSAFGKKVVLNYRKRRYCCPNCKKRFSEDHPFVPKYHRMTSRLVANILEDLSGTDSFTNVAKKNNVSTSTVIRIFDNINYIQPLKPPKALAIDEFKGNTGKEKYQCILTDPVNKQVIDILPSRNSSELISYFRKWDKKDRRQVKFFVSDMWKPYAELADTFFKESIQLVDKYHYIRQAVWAFEAVRKRIQKEYSKQYRLAFKHSKKVLTKRFDKLNDLDKIKVNNLLYISKELLEAHTYKENFLKIVDCGERKQAKEMLKEWIYAVQASSLNEFINCSKTYINWQKGILNTFDYEYSNGFTEGCNNKIKVLKRNAYGYRNFKRFRNRILFMFADKNFSNNKTAA